MERANQMTEDNQRVTTADQDIPFGRMVVLSFKWAFAATPAIVTLFLLWALLLFVSTG